MRSTRQLSMFVHLAMLVVPMMFVSLEASAARTLRVASYPVRYIFEYNSTPLHVCNTGERMGAMISYMMSFTNLSSIPQTITVTTLPGSYGGAVTNSCGAWPDQRFSHCFEDNSGNVANGATGVNPTTKIIPANGTIGYRFVAVAWSPFGNTCGTGHNHGDFFMSISFEVKVNEDRGAIQGTLVPMLDAPVPGGQACGISLPPTPICNPILDRQRSTVPLPINGGRPF